MQSTNNERVLFSIMASPGLPVISPFKTSEAEKKYEKLYEEGRTLRVIDFSTLNYFSSLFNRGLRFHMFIT